MSYFELEARFFKQKIALRPWKKKVQEFVDSLKRPVLWNMWPYESELHLIRWTLHARVFFPGYLPVNARQSHNTIWYLCDCGRPKYDRHHLCKYPVQAVGAPLISFLVAKCTTAVSYPSNLPPLWADRKKKRWWIKRKETRSNSPYPELDGNMIQILQTAMTTYGMDQSKGPRRRNFGNHFYQLIISQILLADKREEVPADSESQLRGKKKYPE